MTIIVARNGIITSKYDECIQALARTPGEWAVVPVKNSTSAHDLQRRYGAPFEFVTRKNPEGGRTVYCRYLGEAPFILDDFLAHQEWWLDRYRKYAA